jgi:hypothetical protein
MGGGRKKIMSKPHEVYNNAKYSRCEACLIWSGMSSKWTWIQKTLSNMKGGAPSFCRPEDAACQAKEETFAACSGVAVCAADCWSEEGNDLACKQCKSKWCEQHPNAVRNNKYFRVCQAWDKCYKEFHPSTFASADWRVRRQGRMNCWGIPHNKPNTMDLDPSIHWNVQEMCAAVSKGRKFAYPNWHRYWKNCTENVCDLDSSHSNPTLCENLHCQKVCKTVFLFALIRFPANAFLGFGES